MGGAIAVALQLREPKYQETAAYCHFGRAPYTKDGMKFFEWENPKDLRKYVAMSSEEVTAALNGSNYLVKWVDLAGHLRRSCAGARIRRAARLLELHACCRGHAP